MRELEKAIRTLGKAEGTNVVKVDMFLNHRLETALIFRGKNMISSGYFAIRIPTNGTG